MGKDFADYIDNTDPKAFADFVNKSLKNPKEYEKKKRAFLREVKMSKETPTKKQLYYYDKLCKKYNLEKQELTSKLQARDEIDRIINEYSRDFENID